MRLAVIGGVAAGLSAASQARRLDPSLQIAVFEKGGTISYGACGLPYLVEGRVRKPEELIVHTPEFFRRERDIEVRTNTEVTAIHHSRRELALASGERVPYDRLVIATGARPVRLGPHSEHVFHLHTFEDGVRVRDFLRTQKPRTAAVIGAGYIGLEAAEALRSNGLSVNIFECSPHVLGRDDSFLTEWTRKQLERFGISIELSCPVKKLENLKHDLVIVAAGVAPNAELAREAGIDIGRTGAIRVTDRMETNLGGVYAAGDCAETTHLLTGAPAYIPLGTTANKMGRVAGANAAGRRERFPGVCGTAIVRVCGTGVGVTGFSCAQARREGFQPVSARITAKEKAAYFRGRSSTLELVADSASRRILGITVIGDDGVGGRVNTVAAAITGKLRVDDLEMLDLAYAPPFAPVWDPLLICARQLAKTLS
jgi:NADPH-dependent 2,4-dienoyl-CoA reductase/sulfur reductase-like enzyme